MTRQTAYRRLRKFRGQASLDPEGRINITHKDRICCPLGALMDAKFDFPASSTAPAELGLSCEDARAIVSAADLYPEHDPRVRAALLRDLGLEEMEACQ